MNRCFIKPWLFPILLGLGVTWLPNSLDAGPFQSDYTNPAWTVNDGTTVLLTPASATIAENQASSFPSIDLSQSFTVPAGATTLTFSILGLTTDSVQSNTLPAFFAADLLDTSAKSLVPAIPGSTDFYARDLTDPTFNEAAASGVTVTPPNSATAPITVTLDISAIPAGTTANLVFSVFPDGDPESNGASITLSDVSLNGTVATIPEPGSIVLLGIGIAGIAGYQRRQRTK